MKLYVNQTRSRIICYALPVGLAVSIAIPLYQGKAMTSVLLSSIFLILIVGFGLYTTIKQSRVPLFEISEDSLIVNEITRGKREISLDSITGIRKSAIFGYKLTTLSGDVSIPLRSLRRKDREKLLSTLKLQP